MSAWTRFACAIRPSLSTRPSTATPAAAAALVALTGRRVIAVERVGKRLGLRFERGALVMHLGMTGRWETGAEPAHARLGLRVGERWTWFADARRFGCVVPCALDALQPALHAGMGPDALAALPDAEALRERLSGRRSLKVALLDQAVLAGLGNIHVVEALWRAGLHPNRAAGSLSLRECARLRQGIAEQLADALAQLGEEQELVYLTQGGRNPFTVYGREGARCARCGEAIVKATLAARSTWWCPSCQPAPYSNLT